MWSLDSVAEAKAAAETAVELLAPTDEIGGLARAWAAALRMEVVAFDAAAVIAAAPHALEVAARGGLDDVRIDVAISLALAHGHRGDHGAQEQLAETLAAARDARLPFQTIRAYVNAIDVAAEFRDYLTVEALAGEALERLEGFQTAIPRETVIISVARSLLDRGRYAEAIEHAERGRRTTHGGVPLSLALEGTVRARRGEPGADELLRQAWEAIAGIPEGWRHGQIRAALAEAAWLRGDLDAALAHVRAGLAAPYANQLARSSGDLSLWGAPLRRRDRAAVGRADAGRSSSWRATVRGARQEWRRLDAPYEHALAALAGTDRDAREAMAALQRLGADAAPARSRASGYGVACERRAARAAARSRIPPA